MKGANSSFVETANGLVLLQLKTRTGKARESAILQQRIELTYIPLRDKVKVCVQKIPVSRRQKAFAPNELVNRISFYGSLSGKDQLVMPVDINDFEI